MKKKVLAALTVVLCLSILGGVTSAYFTAKDTAHNVITTGNVKIKVVEQQKTDEGLKPYPAGPIQGVMPGAEVSKIVTVKNTGIGDAWVSVRLQQQFVLSKDAPEALPDGEVPADRITLNPNTADWVREGEWYYYKKPLAPGASTTPLFEQVAFDAKMGNAYQGAQAFVNVFAEGVQYRNNETVPEGNYSKIPGWPTAR